MYISIDTWTGMNSNYASGTSVLRVATHAIIVVGLSVMMSGQKRTYSYDYPPVKSTDTLCFCPCCCCCVVVVVLRPR